MMRCILAPLLMVLALVPALVRSQGLSDATLDAVRLRLASSANASWEMGTRAEALLELDNSTASVFASSNGPFSTSSVPSASSLDTVIQIARQALLQRNGTKEIIKDSSAGDPASIGVAVILGNLTNAGTNIDDLTFGTAASDQLSYLLTDAPRNSDGAISHRANEVQLWADFVYMAPPFLAYYGAVTGNKTLVQEAVTQISLYRNNLRDSSTGLWKHIALGKTDTDSGLWATGNAWAAAGIVRVLATIQHSSLASSLKKEQNELKKWAKEIHTAFYKYQNTTSGLLHNYVNDSATFEDAASSILMASTVYRLATLANIYTYIPHAELTHNVTTSHIDSDGWLFPVVNPLDFSAEGKQSPEGQAFVLMQEAAWKEWSSEGRQGVNGASRRVGRDIVGTVVGAIVVAGAMLVEGM